MPPIHPAAGAGTAAAAAAAVPVAADTASTPHSAPQAPIPPTASQSPPAYTVSDAARPSEAALLLRRMIGHNADNAAAAAADDDDDEGAGEADAAASAAPNPHQNYAAPPPYDENDYKVPLPHCKLPTYEEVEREKAARSGGDLHTLRALHDRNSGEALHMMSADFRRGIPVYPYCSQPSVGVGAAAAAAAAATTVTMTDGTSAAIGGGADTDPENLLVSDDALLGTDLMFVGSFLVAFLFNWMGFLLITCACHNIAARYGSLSGFGLSLAKWTMIVKSSTNMITTDENAWLWWLIMAFGVLICVRSAVQYVGIKRSWRRMTVASAERMLIYDH